MVEKIIREPQEDMRTSLDNLPKTQYENFKTNHQALVTAWDAFIKKEQVERLELYAFDDDANGVFSMTGEEIQDGYYKMANLDGWSIGFDISVFTNGGEILVKNNSEEKTREIKKDQDLTKILEMVLNYIKTQNKSNNNCKVQIVNTFLIKKP